MADGIRTEHELPHAHHGGVLGALRDMPKWGWFAIGGAVLVLVLWKMRSGSASTTTTATVPTDPTTVPTDPGVTAGGGSPTPDNTDAILSGFQAIETQNQQSLAGLMQQQSDAIGAALDASSQQQIAALQGLSSTESGITDMLSTILSSVQAYSQNPIVSNLGTNGSSSPGPGAPLGVPPVGPPVPSYYPPLPPTIVLPGNGAKTYQPGTVNYGGVFMPAGPLLAPPTIIPNSFSHMEQVARTDRMGR